MIKGLLAGAAAASLLFASDLARISAFDHQQATARYQDVYYLPPTDWLLLGSLGYREALASLIWNSALVNFGQEIGHKGEVKFFFNYADAILALDPDFKRVYTWTATVAMYRPVLATKEEALRAATYLERAHKRFPTDGDIAWDLAAFYAYELPPVLGGDERTATEVKRRAADYMRVAALLGGGPPWIGLTAARRLDELGQSEQAARHLLEIYATVDDPETKAALEQRIRKLRTDAFMLAMRAASQDLEQRRLNDYPYLDSTMYVLVGSPAETRHREALLNNFDPELTRALRDPGDRPPARPPMER